MLLIGFVLLMVGTPFPAASAYVRFAVSSHDSEARKAVLERVRPGLMRLAVVWAVVVAGFFAWFALDWTAIASGARSNLPWTLSMGAFHVLWWPFAMPVLRRLDTRTPDAGDHDGMVAQPVRVAALKPRRVTEYLSRGQRLLPIALAIAAPPALFIRAWHYPPLEGRPVWGACIFGAAGFTFLISYAVWIRFEVRASYGPIGQDEAEEEVLRETERLRRFRLQAIFWLQVLGAAAFFAGAALVLEVGRGTIQESTAGLIGGLGGTAVGCVGGLFGGLAGLRGYRLNVLKAQHRGQE
jgi:hypothetical protein